MRESLVRATDWLIIPVSLGMVIFHVHNIIYPYLSPVQAQNVHLCFGLSLIFLTGARNASHWCAAALSLLFLTVSLAASAYIGFGFEELQNRIGLATPTDTIVGVLMILVILEAARRSFGLAIPAVAIGMLLYAYFGSYMPGFLQHAGFSFARLIGNVTTYLTGAFSGLLQISATIIAIFMIFGGILGSSGASNYFVKLALRLGRRLRSGPALAAVVASALFGSVNGSPVANVSTTGIFTIPLMTRHGYSPRFASATEAVASTGGTLMPPVMGVAAFLMASITGIPYLEIAGHALIPAFIYFLSVGLAIHLRSVRLDLKPAPVTASRDPATAAFFEGMTFFLPFALIITLMLMRYPVSYAALVGLTSLVFLVVARSALQTIGWLPVPETVSAAEAASSADSVAASAPQPLIRQIIDGARDGARGAARIAAVCAALGIIVHAFTMTGLAGRIVHGMTGLSGDHIIAAMLVVAAVSILFGLGVPTAGSYVIVAILGAPVLTGLDVPVVAAHMFVLYFTMLSGLTPPVGATVIVASQIARTGYWLSAATALRLALPGFIMPVIYVFEPGILGIGDPTTIAVTATSVIVGMYALTGAFEGFLIVACRFHERVALFVAAAALLAGGVVSTTISAVGLAILAVVAALHYRRRRPGLAPDQHGHHAKHIS